MNELIPITVNENSEPIVSARILYEFLEISERYSKWFDRMVGYGFTENLDYTPYQMVHPQNNQEIEDHALKLDVAKEIAMIQRNEKGKQARQYFIQVEKEWNSPDKVMARALLMAEKTIKQLKLESEKKEQLIEEQRPKVIFADSVSASKNSILAGDMAKILKQNGTNIGETRFFAWLREQGYICKDKPRWNKPTQKSMDLKIMEYNATVINRSNGTILTRFTPKITGKGQLYFINKFRSSTIEATADKAVTA